jgi:hypothetical protein
MQQLKKSKSAALKQFHHVVGAKGRLSLKDIRGTLRVKVLRQRETRKHLVSNMGDTGGNELDTLGAGEDSDVTISHLVNPTLNVKYKIYNIRAKCNNE